MWLISNKVGVADSGLLEGFRDCHCHLVPGVDDGVKTLEDSLRILEKWNELGVKEVWMTPHIMEDIPNKPEKLKEIFDNVESNYSGDIKLHLAAENMLDNLFLTRLDEGIMLPIGSKRKHLLVETSYYNPPMDMDRYFERIKEKLMPLQEKQFQLDQKVEMEGNISNVLQRI